jgi:peptide/nickel transport system substrate-binding protein
MKSDKYGSVMIAAAGYDLQSFDPGLNGGMPTLAQMTPVLSNILQQDMSDWQGIVPDLAESWDISGDGLSVSFKIRSDVNWQDGTSLTAEDVRYNVWRWINRPNKVPYGRMSCLRAVASDVNVSGDEVILNLNEPSVSIIPCIGGNPYAVIFQKETLEKADAPDSDFKFSIDDWIGSGPFKVKSHQRDVGSVLERNDDYYEESLPYLDGLEVNIISDISTQVAAFRTKRLDMTSMFPPLTPTEALGLQESFGDTVNVKFEFPTEFVFFMPNQNHAPWDNVRLRQAVHLALNRQDFIDVVGAGFGQISPMYSTNFPQIYTLAEWQAMPGFNLATKEADIAKAKEIIQEEFGGTVESSIMCRPVSIYCDNAQIIVAQLEKIGVMLEIDVQEPRAGLTLLRTGDFDSYTGSTSSTYDDPDAYNAGFFVSGVGGNADNIGYHNDEINELFIQQSSLTDEAERAKVLRQMADVLMVDQPFIGLFNNAIFQAYWGYVNGWSVPKPAQPSRRMHQVWLDK